MAQMKLPGKEWLVCHLLAKQERLLAELVAVEARLATLDTKVIDAVEAKLVSADVTADEAMRPVSREVAAPAPVVEKIR